MCGWINDLVVIHPTVNHSDAGHTSQPHGEGAKPQRLTMVQLVILADATIHGSPTQPITGFDCDATGDEPINYGWARSCSPDHRPVLSRWNRHSTACGGTALRSSVPFAGMVTRREPGSYLNTPSCCRAPRINHYRLHLPVNGTPDHPLSIGVNYRVRFDLLGPRAIQGVLSAPFARDIW